MYDLACNKFPPGFAGDNRTNSFRATGGSLVNKMADCLPSRSVKNCCCLSCRHVDKVRFFRFPRDPGHRQLRTNYCENLKPGYTLKESHLPCSVSKNALHTLRDQNISAFTKLRSC